MLKITYKLSGAFFQEFYLGNWRIQDQLVNYWRPDNQDNPSHCTIHYNGKNSTNLLTIFRYGTIDGKGIVPSDYFRLKDIYLGYTINSDFLSHIIDISKINVYIIGNNLWTISKFKMCDPDRKDVSVGYHPLMASVQVGMTFDF